MNLKTSAFQYFLFCSCLSIFFSETAAQNKIFHDINSIIVADIKFNHFERKPTSKKPVKQADSPSSSKHKNQQYEVKGYINDQYVRISIQITEDNVLFGYMFIENAPAEYVYGELVNGTLYMYDTKGELYTVLLAK